MTKDHKIFSLQLSAQELADLDAEAQAAPFLGNRSDYGRAILAGRHAMRIVAAPQAQHLIDHYSQQMQQQEQDYQDQAQQQEQAYQHQVARAQGRIEGLEEILTAANERLVEQGQALAQLQGEYEQLFIKQQVQEATLSDRSQQLQQSTQQVQQWKSKYQETRQLADQLSRQLKEAKGVAQWVDTLSKGMGQVVEKNPNLAQRVAEQGLQGLWFGKPRPQAAPVKSRATQVGEALEGDFPGPQLEEVLELLQYLLDHPQAKAAWLGQAEVVAYRAKLRVERAQKQGSAKATGAAAR